MVVVDRVDSDHPVRTFHTIGDTSPLHATAAGRAILTHLPKRDVEELIAQGLERFSDTTPADPDELRAELDRIRTDGYAVNRNQYRPGVCAIAAPVLDEDGSPLAAIAVSMPESRFDVKRLPEWSRMVVEAAAEITGRRRG
ncbi:IclR family transcriptional regulator C-terminal domain-containing protein, partial [Streptomyces sp. NPDC012510]|uniref:IclR family transcriptional regulator n=1 Tax=Streptomyces sp. NPDC012510 TaxID=3364838 RepID=UPI0036ECD13A